MCLDQEWPKPVVLPSQNKKSIVWTRIARCLRLSFPLCNEICAKDLLKSTGHELHGHEPSIGTAWNRHAYEPNRHEPSWGSSLTLRTYTNPNETRDPWYWVCKAQAWWGDDMGWPSPSSLEKDQSCSMSDLCLGSNLHVKIAKCINTNMFRRPSHLSNYQSSIYFGDVPLPHHRSARLFHSLWNPVTSKFRKQAIWKMSQRNYWKYVVLEMMGNDRVQQHQFLDVLWTSVPQRILGMQWSKSRTDM